MTEATIPRGPTRKSMFAWKSKSPSAVAIAREFVQVDFKKVKKVLPQEQSLTGLLVVRPSRRKAKGSI